MSVNIEKIRNIVHASGYKLEHMRVEDVSSYDLYKFKIPQLNPVQKQQRSGFFPLMHFFLRPIEMDKIVLKEFTVEEFYIDLMEFIEVNKKIFAKGINYFFEGFGDSNHHFLHLVNKYGWLNWANEKIDIQIYDYLPNYERKYGLEHDLFEHEKYLETETLAYGFTSRFISQLIPSQEHIQVWTSLFYDLYHNEGTSEDLIQMVGMKEDKNGNKKIHPISPGASLMYFHQLKMPNYYLEKCNFCENKYIKKKRRLFCSDSCRVKSHNNKKQSS